MKKYKEFMTEKDALHGHPAGYGKGIKGKDEKKQKDAFDKNVQRYKDNPDDPKAFEPTAVDKKIMKKREQGKMPKAPKSQYTEGLFDFEPRKKILDPSMFSSKKDDIAKLIQFQQKALAMKPGDSKRAAMMKEIQKIKQRLGIAEEVTVDEIVEACWKGYKQVGMKKKGDRMVPDCVPEENLTKEEKQAIIENPDTFLKNKAKESGEPLGDLKKVYKKGLAAYASGHRPGMSQHQWAAARVNSYIKGGKARTVDAHVRKESAKAKLKVKARSVKANVGVRG